MWHVANGEICLIAAARPGKWRRLLRPKSVSSCLAMTLQPFAYAEVDATVPANQSAKTRNTSRTATAQPHRTKKNKSTNLENLGSATHLECSKSTKVYMRKYRQQWIVLIYWVGLFGLPLYVECLPRNARKSCFGGRNVHNPNPFGQSTHLSEHASIWCVFSDQTTCSKNSEDETLVGIGMDHVA